MIFLHSSSLYHCKILRNEHHKLHFIFLDLSYLSVAGNVVPVSVSLVVALIGCVSYFNNQSTRLMPFDVTHEGIHCQHRQRSAAGELFSWTLTRLSGVCHVKNYNEGASVGRCSLLGAAYPKVPLSLGTSGYLLFATVRLCEAKFRAIH